MSDGPRYDPIVQRLFRTFRSSLSSLHTIYLLSPALLLLRTSYLIIGYAVLTGFTSLWMSVIVASVAASCFWVNFYC